MNFKKSITIFTLTSLALSFSLLAEGTMEKLGRHLEFTVSGWARYMDNRDSNPEKEDNTDLGVSPEISWLQLGRRSYMELSYLLTYRWRENPSDSQNEDEWFHRLSLAVSRDSSSRLSWRAGDTFAYTDDPAVDAASGRERPDASYFYNDLRLGAAYEVARTMVFDLGGGMINKRYDEDEVADTLDRDEFSVKALLRKQVLADLTVHALYNWKSWDYADKESDFSRDFGSHYTGVGGQYNLSSSMVLELNGGVQVTDYDDDDIFEDSTNPFVNASLSDQLLPLLDYRLETGYDVDNADIFPYSGEETVRFYGRVGWQLAQSVSTGADIEYKMISFDAADPSDATSETFDGGDEDRIYASAFMTYYYRNLALTLKQSYEERDSDLNSSFEKNETQLRVSYTF